MLWQHPLDYTYQQRYLEEKASVTGVPTSGDNSALGAMGAFTSASVYGATPGTPQSKGSDTPTMAESSERGGAAVGMMSPKEPPLSSGQSSSSDLPYPAEFTGQGDEQLISHLQLMLGSKQADLRSLLLEPATVNEERRTRPLWPCTATSPSSSSSGRRPHPSVGPIFGR